MNYKVFKLGIGIAALVVFLSGITNADPGLQGVTAAGLLPLSHAVMLTSAAAQTGEDNAYARRLAASGNTLYTIGSVMAWGGLIGSLAAGLFQEPEAALAAQFLNLIGVPIMGIGAGKIAVAAQQINPRGMMRVSSGWGWYAASWGLPIAGIAGIFFMATVTGTETSTVLEGINVNPAAFLVPGILIFSGAVSYYVSWYKFSRRKDMANMAIASLDIKPVIRLGEHGSTALGGQLALHF